MGQPILPGRVSASQKLQNATETRSTHGRKVLSQQYGGEHTGGWVDLLPKSCIPYVQLARLSPPAGLLLIYIPHFLGLLLAAVTAPGAPHHLTLLWKPAIVLFGGSVFCSNAAHAWNDVVDVSFDRFVARTRSRPIARGAISRRAALLFVVSQAALAGTHLFAFPRPRVAWWWALPNMMATTYYPWAKRHTHLAQVVLGFCLSWGIFLGAVALPPLDRGGDPGASNPSTICMVLACILWTVIYDTVYAHQDMQHDLQLGLKSTAVLFGDKTKSALLWALACMVGLLGASGHLAGFGTAYFILTLGGCTASLGAMVLRVNLQDNQSCWWWFRYGFWLPSASMVAGLAAEYSRRL